ncbi:hypothetical protein [Oscillatoria acuminata]|uniref:Low temperature-induced protein n=1 Tax=Oscillatoria acuminata PCC 6304 TaxID=56110 RepID=K9TEP7_9CYAN|nr:hypothetical protein [Oscillatoria acuminata]AFY80616.1 hypothetical protein Oscil6304_0883 [Oscillatoria acuminata PCC 6304]
MQRIVSALKQVRLGLMAIACAFTFISVSGAFAFAHPSQAATGLDSRLVKEEYKIDNNQRDNQLESREESYEKMLEEAKNIHTEEKAYEENLSEYREENPTPGLAEKAQGLLEKLTDTE